MERMTANEFLREDGHGNHAPSYDTVSEIYDELSRETLGADTFYADFANNTLSYGDDLEKKITAEQWERIGERCGLMTGYVKEIALEYAEGERTWVNLW